MLAALGLLSGAGCGSSDSQEPGDDPGPFTTAAHARGADEVFVTNSPNAPVPTAAVGTTAVVGTVAATQEGAWNVNIANPQLAVTVANGNANALPVRSVDVQTQWQRSQFISIGPGSFGIQASFYTVPAGKRLVVEYVAAFVDVPPGQRASSITVASHVHGSYAQFYVPLAATGPYNVSDRFGVGQVTKIYADPGTSLDYGFDRSAGAGSATAFISMSGHLVNVP